MKITFFRHMALLVTVLFLVACNLPKAVPSPEADALSTMVAETMQALTLAATHTPSTTPTLQFTLTPSATLSPSPTMTPSLTPTKSVTPTSEPGSLSGGIYGYPYGAIPSLTVVATNQTTHYYWYWITGSGNTYYSMTDYIPPGNYQVVAYDASGHAGGCTNIVTVTGGQTASCDITDWSGSYPGNPVH